jgi:hypothetical protein
MSKMEVGIIISPAIAPQRIDCGLRKTVFSALAAACSQLWAPLRRIDPASAAGGAHHTPIR